MNTKAEFEIGDKVLVADIEGIGGTDRDRGLHYTVQNIIEGISGYTYDLLQDGRERKVFVDVTESNLIPWIKELPRPKFEFGSTVRFTARGFAGTIPISQEIDVIITGISKEVDYKNKSVYFEYTLEALDGTGSVDIVREDEIE